MTKNKVEQRVQQINVVCITLMVVLAIILAVRLNIFAGSCPSCFADSLLNRLLIYLLAGLVLGYIASIPIMIYKVRQSKKIIDEDCDEGSCSY